ncbi:MAG TPA: isoprenylcysteine carboxylmethyltransferase family protein, partial [Candidatus Limnocylindria bacterium]|nr:isoprenylcysteine carboxylmethyltransferase family protein [Candidatus Limnocylindria bacterium]
MTVRLSNLPLPEPHLALLGAGIVLQRIRPMRLPRPGGRFAPLGVSATIGASAAAIVWATRAAGSTDLAEPERLVTDGPYAITRHPMYEAWTATYAALALALRNGWLALFFPVLIALVHRETGREDHRLRERFGQRHEAYARAVPRYLTVGLMRSWAQRNVPKEQ